MGQFERYHQLIPSRNEVVEALADAIERALDTPPEEGQSRQVHLAPDAVVENLRKGYRRCAEITFDILTAEPRPTGEHLVFKIALQLYRERSLELESLFRRLEKGCVGQDEWGRRIVEAGREVLDKPGFQSIENASESDLSDLNRLARAVIECYEQISGQNLL